MKVLNLSVIAFVLVVFSVAAAAAGTLQDVKAKGYIAVGVNEGLFGFSKTDEKGEWRGLDVDTARAVSVAVFGAPDKIKWVPLTAKTRFTALQSGEIDVLTRAIAPNPDDHIILPEIISREPLGPAVRHGDDQWADIVKFSTMALIEAEYLGITSKNIDQMLKNEDPKIQRFVGGSKGNGKALGLDEKWCRLSRYFAQVISGYFTCRK